MGKRLRRRGDDEEADVNLTPMLDVVFIMLIFFIVTASFSKENGVDVNRPDSSGPPSETNSPSIILEITAQDEVRLGPRRIDIRRVTANVQERLAANPRSSVVLNVNPDATNGTFVTVLDQAKLAFDNPKDAQIAVVQPKRR